MAEYKDYFSGHASSYSEARPDYPAEIFAYLSSLCATRERAWDCACGNGQATLGMIAYFDQIIATDGSEDQLARARQHDKIQYRKGLAETFQHEKCSLDLITVAQALHWFNLGEFYRNVEFSLKPSGVLAVWCYGLLSVIPAVDTVIQHLYKEVLSGYWPIERRHVETRYSEIYLPYQEVVPPSFAMTRLWSLGQLINYLESWSAVQRFMQTNNANPVALLKDNLVRAWGSSIQREVSWPLTVRVSIKPG